MESSLNKLVEGLNPAQKEAVMNYEGPSLIIAGAGSGKTKVLTSRIAYLIANGVNPSSILALTFTKKAANEMKTRIAGMVGEEQARRIWMGTFHSIFIRFLRLYADRIGYPKDFTIYDTSDSVSCIKSCIKEMQLDAEIYKPNAVLSRISKAKNNLVTPEYYMKQPNLIADDRASKRERLCEVYMMYAKKCRMAGAMDYDDILLYTNILFKDNADALDELRSRFSYILVDEYQDTNYSQYLIVKKLSASHRNLCVVGDDAQSIYAFRGARIQNILNFRKDYPDTKEYRLEQNYRSTQTIVNAANSIISNNTEQLKKKCFSEAEVGDRIKVRKGDTEHDEAYLIVSEIQNNRRKDQAKYSDFAILYRTNAQSRSIEEALRKSGIPYKIYGGHSFYDRAEVKDVLAYLRLIVNPKDDESFKRVINFPARGIGLTTLSRVVAAAAEESRSLLEAILTSDMEAHDIKKAMTVKLKAFASMIMDLHEKSSSISVEEMLQLLDQSVGIKATMELDGSTEGKSRLENINELFNSVKDFCKEVEEQRKDLEKSGTAEGVSDQPDDGTRAFIENITLLSDMDREGDEDNDKVMLMTVHSSKGLEFPYVHIAGMEEMLFPSITSTTSESEIEEERRLFYVAVTRAKKKVFLSFAGSRFKWGSTVSCKPSRFLSEIDSQYREPIPESDDEGGMDRDESYGSFRGRGSYGSFGSYGGRSSSGGHSSFGGSNASFGSRSSGRSVSRTNSSSSSSSSGRFSDRIASAPVRKAPIKPADPNFKADAPDSFKAGDKILHDRFGEGVIMEISGTGADKKASVEFAEGGKKVLLMKYAKICHRN